MKPLLGRLQIKSDSPSVVEEAICRLVARCTVETPTGSKGIDYSGDFVGWQDFALGEARTDSGLSLVTTGASNVLVCAIPVEGSVTYFSQAGLHRADPGEVVMGDTQYIERTEFSGGHRQYFLTAPMKAVNAHFAAMDGRGRVDFRRLPVKFRSGETTSMALSGFAPLVSELLRDRDLLQLSPIKLRRCRDAFLEIIWRGFVDRGLIASQGSSAGGLRHVRDAEDFMRGNCHAPIGVSEVAEHLGISIRALQHAFKHHSDASPLARLQKIRLEGLRAALASPGDEDWRLIATRWGFTSPSRLTRQYTAAFGETPVQTRRRARARKGDDSLS